jgi:hypothetical protein
MAAEQSMKLVELAQKVRSQLVNCIGFEGDELAHSRKMAYDYYFQRARGDEVAGRSEIVSGDLSSMVEGNLAMMTEPLIGKRIAEFCAYDATDEEQAQLETDCVAEMIFKRQNGFMEVVAAVKDALLLRNSVIKVFVDERTHVSNIVKDNVDPEIVTNLLDQIGQTDVHSYDPEKKRLKATVTKVTRKFKGEALAPENFLFPKHWHRQDLEDIPFCAERHVEPRSTLVERGFPKDKVAALTRWNNPWQAAADARLPRTIQPSNLPIDSSQELVEWYECYVKMDDGSGASELHEICISGEYILSDELVDMIPYATGVAIINPHTFMGISLFDKLKGVQDASTALNRALQDNLNTTNKNRTAHLDGVVEESDLTDGRTNGSIRVKPGMVSDVRAAVAAFSVPDTSANILANIEHMRRVRAEMGGATLDMATGQMQLSERVGSMGLDRAYSVMEQLAAFMTRMLANTLVRSMYLIAHETLRTQWQGAISFKRGKEWIQQNPSKWQVRDAVSVNLGASVGERQRIAAVFDSLLNKQAMLAQNGMEEILIDVTSFFNAAMQWLRINDVDNPEKYFLDPRSPQAVKAMKDKAVQRQQTQQKQDAMMQQAIGLEQVRVALSKYQTDVKTQFDYYNTVLNAQIEEAKLAVQGVVDLAKTRTLAKEAQGNEQTPTDSGSDKAGESTAGESSTDSGAGSGGEGRDTGLESGE